MFKPIVKICILGLFFFAGCSSISVRTDFDPSAKFSNLRTFNWYSTIQNKTGDIRIDNPILDSRIREIVEQQLALRGYKKTSSVSPDFYLNYTLVVDQKTSVQTVDRYYGYSSPAWQYGHGYYGAGYMGPDTRVYNFEMGTLILDILKVEGNKLIWRGSAAAEVKDGISAQQRNQRITTAVEKMLVNFPPK